MSLTYPGIYVYSYGIVYLLLYSILFIIDIPYCIFHTLYSILYSIDGINTGLVTIPGEALSDLGKEIRSDLLQMKFKNVFLGG